MGIHRFQPQARLWLFLALTILIPVSGCTGSATPIPLSPWSTATTPSSPSPTTSSSVPASSPTGLSVTWTKTEQGNFPPDRIDYSLTYDSKRDRLLFFGGLSIEAAKYLSDLWAFDFSTNRWELLSEGKELPAPLHYPHPASDRGIVYDPLKDRLLLFQCGRSMEAQLTEGNQPLPLGGDSSTQSEYEVQVFVFNLEEKYWTQLNPPQKPPDRLEWFRTVWDPKNDRVFLFGGRLIIQGPKPSEVEEVQAKDLWVFNCKEEHWQELANNITLPGIYPIDLGPSSYDPKEDRLLVLKPKANGRDLCDISALRLSGSSWMDLKSSNPPVFRVQKYVAYDPLFHVLILPVRGESETVGEIKEEIWIYNLARNSWSYCKDLPGNDWNHVIVSGKPGEVYILTLGREEPSLHNLWHLTLGP